MSIFRRLTALGITSFTCLLAAERNDAVIVSEHPPRRPVRSHRRRSSLLSENPPCRAPMSRRQKEKKLKDEAQAQLGPVPSLIDSDW